MAKRRGRPPGSKNQPTRSAGVPENIGTALGRVAARLDGWLAQRNEIARELNDVIQRAQGMLSQIGERDIPWPFRGKGWRRSKVTTPSMVAGAIAATNEAQLRERRRGKRKKFTLSAEARKRISEAQKARWAAQRKAGAKSASAAKKAKKAKKADSGAAGTS